jgi:HK97 family phage major capsid protein
MPPEISTEPTLLDRLSERRQVAFDAWAKFVEEREATETAFETRMASDEDKPTEDEIAALTEGRTAYRAQADQLDAEVKDFDRRIADQKAIELRRKEAADAARGKDTEPTVVINREPLMYEREKGMGSNGISYWRDIAATLVPGVTFQGTTKSDAEARLFRHRDEMAVELPKRMKAKVASAQRQVAKAEGGELRYDPFHRGQVHNPFEQRVEPNLTQGQGGYFVPPLWLVEQFIPGLRAHLVAAALCRQMDLPTGTDSINIPKLANLTTVGYQQANNSGLPSTDWSDTAVQANVKTIGGYSDVALQLLEQSPNEIVDEVVTTDLMAAYNTFLDLQVLAGDGVSTSVLNGGHLQGIYSSAGASAWSGYNGITYTDGSPAGWKFPSVLGAMASQIGRTRFDTTNFRTVLHGRRWFWYSTSVDANDRPLGETVSGGRYNIAAAIESGIQPEGLVGSMPSIADTPVYIDDNVPTTDTAGGGTLQDIAISALWDDLWLFQGDLRTDVFREVLSGSLGVRFRLYNYAAFLARYGQSIAIGSGSGFSAPTGAVSSIVF